MAVRDVSDHLSNQPTKVVVISRKMYFHDCMPVLPLIVRKDHKESSESDKIKLNSLLRIHMDNFLTFFALRRLDEEFSGKFDGKLSFLTPSSVILNGLDDKIYNITNVDDISYISPYHKAKKDKTLSGLLPLKGSIRISNLTDRFRRILSQDSSDSRRQ